MQAIVRTLRGSGALQVERCLLAALASAFPAEAAVAGHRAAAASHAASRVVHAKGCGFSSTARWSAEMHERDPQGPLGNAPQQPHCEDGDQDGPQREPASAQFHHQRQQLLAATLRHVPQHGWAGGAAAAAAASELRLSPAAVGMLGSDAQLVQLFVADCNARLEQQLASMQKELGGMDTSASLDADCRRRLKAALQLRLGMLEPYISHWAQALSLLAQPAAAQRTLQLYTDLADSVWHAAGDISTDSAWYTRRALLMGAYTASELYMLSDCSPGFADTWDALDRRLEGVLGAEGAAGGSLIHVVGNAAGEALAQLGSLLRRP